MNIKRIGISLVFMLAILSLATLVIAGDFDWAKDFNIRAEVDPDGFRAQLSTRFHIGDAQVKIVLGHVDKPVDAYMVLRLGEMSSRPIDYVLDKYKAEKSKGWGGLKDWIVFDPKSLGIKPGSREFHALKQGSDIYSVDNKSKNHQKKKNKGKG